MRQLKFRAWDKKKKKWLGPNLHMAVIDGMLYWQFGYGCEILSAEERENIELMEYTGLKDKNGKEIYKGDIMKAELPVQAGYPGIGTLKRKTIIGAVRIRPLGGTGILVKKIIGDDIGIQIGAFLKIKQDSDTIIGNLYENPELKGPVPSEEDVRAEKGEDEVADKRDANKQEEEFYNDFHQTGGGGERQ